MWRWLVGGLIGLAMFGAACADGETAPTPTSTSIPVADPTDTAAPTLEPRATPILTPDPTATATVPPTLTPTPTREPDVRTLQAEELFRSAMVVMNALESFRMEVVFTGDEVDDGPVFSIEGAKSGDRDRTRIVVEGILAGFIEVSETVRVPPHVYYFDSDEEKWYRETIDDADPSEDVFPLETFKYLLVDPEIPLRFYDLSSPGNETIDDILTRRIIVTPDWQGIVEWLESERKLAALASSLSPGETPEEFKESYADDPPGTIEVWIDKNGLLRRMSIREEGGVFQVDHQYFAFNQPISIEAPAQFVEGPRPSRSSEAVLEAERVEEISPPTEEVRGVEEIAPGLILRGAVIGTSTDQETVVTVKFKLTNRGAEPIDLSLDSTLVAYTDVNNHFGATGDEMGGELTWSYTWLVGSETDLDAREVVELTVDVSRLPTPLGPNTVFRIEVLPAFEAVLVIQRTTPMKLQGVMDLQ